MLSGRGTSAKVSWHIGTAWNGENPCQPGKFRAERIVCREADIEAREKLNLDCLLPRHGTNPMKDP